MKPIITAISLFAGIAFLASCSDNKSEPPTSANRESPKTGLSVASGALKEVFAQVEQAPVGISKARATVKPGDPVVLTGVVMGNLRPFVEGRAAFILGDPEKLIACDKRPGDDCKTPWDVCCETPEDIKEATATIQVVDADGRVLKEAIENVNGLKALSTVIVKGTAAASSNENLLVVNAEAIQVLE